jgi:hypothetical protein
MGHERRLELHQKIEEGAQTAIRRLKSESRSNSSSTAPDNSMLKNVGDCNLSDIALLEALIVDNKELEQLESLLEQFNIFEAIGAVRQELRHSDFLAFLLDPQQNHGLGDTFAKKLLQRLLSNFERSRFPVSPIDFDVWSLDQTVVLREWQSIDVLLVDELHQLVVLIENKVDSSEHSNQLARYYNIVQQHYSAYKIIAIYLTPEGDDPSDERYVAASYKLIGDLVQELVHTRSSTLGSDVRTLMLHYSQMLGRHIVSDSQIAELCRRIYQKHKKALDLIYEHRPDQQQATLEIIKKLVQQESSLIVDHISKSSLKFAVADWDIPYLLQGQGWTRSGRLLLFEFFNFETELKLMLLIGPGPEEVTPVRQKLLDVAHHDNKVLKPAFTKLGAKHNTIYRRSLLTPKDYEQANAEERETKIKQQWERFLEEDLPKIKAVIEPLLVSTQ